MLAWAVGLALMPKGVEHSTAAFTIPSPSLVGLALMPKGVEHLMAPTGIDVGGKLASP